MYSINIDKIPCDLEITEKELICTSIGQENFKILFKDIRALQFQKPKSIALNFYVDKKLKFIRFTSKYSLDIMEKLESIIVTINS